jgi:hypothetical protein
MSVSPYQFLEQESYFTNLGMNIMTLEVTIALGFLLPTITATNAVGVRSAGIRAAMVPLNDETRNKCIVSSIFETLSTSSFCGFLDTASI